MKLNKLFDYDKVLAESLLKDDVFKKNFETALLHVVVLELQKRFSEKNVPVKYIKYIEEIKWTFNQDLADEYLPMIASRLVDACVDSKDLYDMTQELGELMVDTDIPVLIDYLEKLNKFNNKIISRL